VIGIAMPDWRSGRIGVVEAGREVVEAVPEIMKACGVPTLDADRIPRYKLSCISSLLSRYEFRGVIYVVDVYGIANRVALSKGVDRQLLLNRAWAALSAYICTGGEAECDEEVKLSCCKAPCGALCELAKFVASTSRGVSVDLRKAVEEALNVS
jgi:hypothetical protein